MKRTGGGKGGQTFELIIEVATDGLVRFGNGYATHHKSENQKGRLR